MFNFKKSVLASVLLMGMAASAGANAAANATVVWSGVIPTSNASDEIIITGLSGDLTALNAGISPSQDGVFLSDPIVLESHVNDSSDTANPTVGAKTPANWTLMDVAVTYDGVANPAQVVEVEVNGAPAVVGEVISTVDTITTKVQQTVALPESEVGGASVQASATFMADVV